LIPRVEITKRILERGYIHPVKPRRKKNRKGDGSLKLSEHVAGHDVKRGASRTPSENPPWSKRNRRINKTDPSFRAWSKIAIKIFECSDTSFHPPSLKSSSDIPRPVHDPTDKKCAAKAKDKGKKRQNTGNF
jgi:hypothetical protein